MDRPNVLVIMTDQEPTSTVGCYGNPVMKTPARDRIAAEGMRFENFYIASFPCTPSRASILTGRYAHNHGVVVNDVALSEDLPSLGNTFRAAGYDTTWIGKWHLGGQIYRGVKGMPFDNCWVRKRIESDQNFEFEQVEGGTGEDRPRSGFDHWVGGWTHYRSYLQTTDLPEEVKNLPRVGNHQAAPSARDDQHNYSLLGENHHMAHFFADEMVAFLNGRQQVERPFCAVLSFYGPHLPVCLPKPWDEMYGLDEVDLPENFWAPMDDKPAFQRNNERIFVRDKWTEDQFKGYIRRYRGYVSYIDAQIERVLQALEAGGQAENTIVMFTSDHGDMVGQFGMIYKLTTCGYDTLMKVPFMIRWPGQIPEGQVNRSLASSVDLMPTLLDLAGVEIPDGVDGKPMTDALLGKTDTVRTRVFTNVMNTGIMVREGDWKWVLNWQPAADGARERDELYNLAADPWETTNLADRETEVADRMRNRILEWLVETGHPYVETIREQAFKSR